MLMDYYYFIKLFTSEGAKHSLAVVDKLNNLTVFAEPGLMEDWIIIPKLGSTEHIKLLSFLSNSFLPNRTQTIGSQRCGVPSVDPDQLDSNC